MGLRIGTNIQSLAAQRNLNRVREEQDKSLGKLSSGTRIVRAGDDAAGLAISEKFKADIRSTQQATRNANDGISMIQTAEGGMNEVSNILIRLRELSIQSASDTVGEKERMFSDLEFQNLVQEVERIGQSTKFNGRALLNGEGDNVDIQIGINNVEALDRLKYLPSETNVTSDGIGIAGLSVREKTDAQENLGKIDDALSVLNGNRAQLGALQNRLSSTVRNLEIQTENLSASNSRIRDTDIAEETSNLTKQNILTSSSISVLAQANNQANQALKLIG